ncbi:urease accessory protein UreD [Pontibacter sp. E15-1]|uniref:urease accessory protein UreD n=1 Tax=Pontibacter sp. E15-1 TaxID=2919918 RepID=UPI001F4F129B|nr:urease accessory protein UreD [Pontibacter sp. E15-1]MCJ8164224.1 urease accessory protein UreD [Pontibacter sp. E15-1]
MFPQPASPLLNASPDWSAVEVEVVRGKSRVVGCRSRQPLKILNPASHQASCHVVLSNFGGGMVSGDQIQLQLRCGAGSRLFLSTQANGRIFKSVDGAEACQTIAGTLAQNALAVLFPDPVVLQEGSRYRQVQHWDIQPKAVLLVIDWFHSGRMDTGERFAFHSFFSELRVTSAGKTLLLDRFSFQPRQHIASAPANFGEYQTIFSAYLVGTPGEALFEQLGERLLQLRMPERTALHFDMTNRNFVLSVVKAKAGVYLLRAMAKTRQDLQPLCDAILSALATDAYLGYNPLQRKY